MQKLLFKEIPFGGDEYQATVRLRDEVLRKPLGLSYTPEVLAAEHSDTHLTAYTEKDNILFACLIMTPRERNKVQMRQFAVHPQYQKQGIGDQLVAYAENWAQNEGFSRIELHARDVAVPFYLRLGYNIKGEEFTEVGIKHRYMVKEI